MTYDPTLVANNVLNRAFAENSPISPMKLQKTMYFLASEYQKACGEPLFPESFETWQYGPVLRSVFNEFRPFSRNFIPRFARDANNNTFMIDEGQDPTLHEILNRVWHAVKDRTAVDLSRITHKENSAWDLSFQDSLPYLTNENIARDITYQADLGLAS